ncbi:MAG: cytochrome P450 [Hyphomicrobiales bacterium]
MIADPFPHLATMREETPLVWNPSLKSGCLTRYDDCCAALADQRFSAARIQPFLDHQSGVDEADLRELCDVFLLWLPFLDPPRHTRLRRLLNTGFTPQAIASLQPKIEKIVTELLDGLKDEEEFDFISRFAVPLPGTVIADILGVPRKEVGQLKIWSDDIAAFVLASRLLEDKYAIAAKATADMREYFTVLIEQRRAEPGDAIIDTLIAAHDGEETLSTAELLSSCILLLFAGHETTTQLFGNSMLALHREPEQRALFRAKASDAGFVANAVEELLRRDGPSVAMVRVLHESVELYDHKLDEGARVNVLIGAANQDPRVFEAPEELRLERESARKQINFGHGIHTCLGARLARLEGAIGFPAILEALENWEIGDSNLEWADSLIIRGLKALPMRAK